MTDNLVMRNIGFQKFSKLNCLWNPEEARNPKLYDSYSYLDLHLNQFLSNIPEDYSFLPNSIYKPSIHVFINNRLVYKTKILDFNNDLFDESIRLKIYSPSTVVTLKLFEHEQFNSTNSDELGLKQPRHSESTDLYLVSWVDLDVGLLVPETDYKVIYTFKSNPSFNAYNPGGILYYPTKGKKPSILSKRVCASCKVCSLLSHLSVEGDEKFEAISKYFDYKFVESDFDSSMAFRDSEDIEDDEELDFVEIIDMTSLTNRSKKDTCNCVSLRSVPSSVQRKKFEACLKCHDYEVCCEHSLSNYYLSVNFKLVPSGDKIDFATELFSCLLHTTRSEPEYRDLASIFERLYQNYYCIQGILNHLQCSRARILLLSKFSLMFLLFGTFLGRGLSAFLFLLSLMFLLINLTSTTQFKKDNGDVLYKSRSLPLLDQGFEDYLMRHIEQEVKEKPLMINGKEYTLEKKQIERNNLNIPEHKIMDKTRVYTKAHTSYRRCENIAVKTICYAISDSIPDVVKGTLLELLDLLAKFVEYANGALALVRYYGIHLSLLTFLSGLLSLRFWRAYNFMFKTLVLSLVLGSLAKNVEFVKYTKSLLKAVAMCLVLRVYRKEWFLNS